MMDSVFIYKKNEITFIEEQRDTNRMQYFFACGETVKYSLE